MSNSSFTPGPWDFWSGYNAVDQMEAEITADDGDIVIARYNYLIREGEANAQLMAAAPELLKALETARLFIVNGIELGFIRMPHSDTPDPAHGTLPAIDAAIAKAKGTPP